MIRNFEERNIAVLISAKGSQSWKRVELSTSRTVSRSSALKARAGMGRAGAGHAGPNTGWR